MSITVMKQALEALTHKKWFRIGLGEPNDPKVEAAIAALRTAIEAAEKQEAAERYIHEYRSKPHPGDFGIPRGHWRQAKQYADVLYTTPPAQSMLQPDAFLQNGMLNPKYTTPPAAQRQPLTDEKIDDIWNRYCDEMGEASINDAYDIARAIEAAHGIKEKNT
jgi:hypothetical protein